MMSKLCDHPTVTHRPIQMVYAMVKRLIIVGKRENKIYVVIR